MIARRRPRVPCFALCGAFAFACADPEPESAVEHGRALFESTELSSASVNRYSCSTCHEAQPGQSFLKLPGGPLAGVTRRTSFWGGQENDLLRSVNACLRYFMLSTRPLVDSDERARALYAFLESLEPGSAEPVPFTIVRSIEDIPRGDAASGAVLYVQACTHCHGELHTGRGRLTEEAPALPDDTIREHEGYSARLLRLVFIEKTRHGVFLGYGGSMPPFSSESLSDAELSAILEYMGITGG